jgi:hypothetical protein
MTISLRLFLEKRAILLIFAYKDESSTDPKAWVFLFLKI